LWLKKSGTKLETMSSPPPKMSDERLQQLMVDTVNAVETLKQASESRKAANTEVENLKEAVLAPIRARTNDMTPILVYGKYSFCVKTRVVKSSLSQKFIKTCAMEFFKLDADGVKEFMDFLDSRRDSSSKEWVEISPYETNQK
jgi:hypothetical protein